MKKRLFIIVFLFTCVFMLTSCDPTPNPEEPSFATIEEGMAAVGELKNYSLSIDLKSIYNNNMENYDSISINVEVSDDKYKISFNIEETEISFFTYKEQNEDLEYEYYIIFNPKDIEIPYEGYVCASITEIIELLGMNPDFELPEGNVSNEQQQVLTALEEFVMFFVDLKDEYFDFNETECYYKINENGKSAFLAAMNKFATSIPDNDVTVEELGITIDITAKTTDKYLTDLSINLTGHNVDNNDSETYKVDVKYSKINETEVVLPTNIISLTKFLEILENGQTEVVYN